MASRDIKLENTLLDSSPRPLVKICDFGYSKHEKFQSAPGSRVGTPAYLAPEVIMTKQGSTYDGKVAFCRASENAGHVSSRKVLSYVDGQSRAGSHQYPFQNSSISDVPLTGQLMPFCHDGSLRQLAALKIGMSSSDADLPSLCFAQQPQPLLLRCSSS